MSKKTKKRLAAKQQTSKPAPADDAPVEAAIEAAVETAADAALPDDAPEAVETSSAADGDDEPTEGNEERFTDADDDDADEDDADDDDDADDEEDEEDDDEEEEAKEEDAPLANAPAPHASAPVRAGAEAEASVLDGSVNAIITAEDDLEDDDDDDGPSALDELADVDPDEALDAFKDYDSLHEEVIGEDALDPSASPSDEERAALVSPKERRLADMRLEARIEAVVFAAQKPLKTSEILDMLGDATLTDDDVQGTLDHLVDFYEERNGGFRLHYLKRLGYQFQTAETAGPIMERMFASRPRPISRAALETLAIIAYRQPVTRAEVEFIRGVDAGSIFKTLLERELIKCTGRKEIVGRPMLFATTDDFLKVFNLSSIKDLPPLEAFQPSRDMVQGAMEKIEGGDALIDVEEYIADNTRGEYEGGELDEPEDDGTNTNSEMVVPAGPGLPEGGGELDH